MTEVQKPETLRGKDVVILRENPRGLHVHSEFH